MADSTQKSGTQGSGSGSQPAGSNTPVATSGGDHDRVAMLSVKADGTPDQVAPEFIIPEEDALRATTEQFRQQAVSAADVQERDQTGDRGTTVEDAPQDPEVERLEKAHKKAASSAERAAKAAVNKLKK